MNFTQIILNIHSINRWAVLIFGLYALTKAVLGLIKNQEYTKFHNMAGAMFTGFIHLQLLLGLILYFVRGWYKNLAHMGEIMGNTTLRFWTIEHLFGMILAAVLIQIGRSKSKKGNNSRKQHKQALLFFGLGLLLIFATIPWPFRGEIARALWP